MRQAGTAIKQCCNTLEEMSVSTTLVRIRNDYLQTKIYAIAQMDTLKRTIMRTSSSNASRWAEDQRSSCKSNDAAVCELLALDQTNPPELGQLCELSHTCISQSPTAGQINVTNPIARFNQVNYRSIRNVGAVTKMYIVKILGKFAD